MIHRRNTISRMVVGGVIYAADLMRALPRVQGCSWLIVREKTAVKNLNSCPARKTRVWTYHWSNHLSSQGQPRWLCAWPGYRRHQPGLYENDQNAQRSSRGEDERTPRTKPTCSEGRLCGPSWLPSPLRMNTGCAFGKASIEQLFIPRSSIWQAASHTWRMAYHQRYHRPCRHRKHHPAPFNVKNQNRTAVRPHPPQLSHSAPQNWGSIDADPVRTHSCSPQIVSARRLGCTTGVMRRCGVRFTTGGRPPSTSPGDVNRRESSGAIVVYPQTPSLPLA